MQQRGTESPHHLDRQILPCLKQRRVQLCKADALPGFFSCGKRPGTVPQAAVENLAVIDLCPHKGAGGGLPAFVGGNQQGFTIFQLHGELGNQGIFISVDATAFLHTGPADPALVITVAQPGAQYVFPWAQLSGHIIGLIGQPAIVGTEAGRKLFRAYGCTV